MNDYFVRKLLDIKVIGLEVYVVAVEASNLENQEEDQLQEEISRFLFLEEVFQSFLEEGDPSLEEDRQEEEKEVFQWKEVLMMEEE